MALLALVAAMLTVPTLASPASAAFTPGQHFSGNYCIKTDCRPYVGYVGANYNPSVPIPLVVYLHGCTQSQTSAEAYTGFDALADSRNFAVLYPGEPVAVGNPEGCWHASPSFYPGEQTRTSVEPKIIVGMTNYVKANVNIDPKRVFVDGASAGGNMSVVMGATYADVYAAVGVNAGCQYLGYCAGLNTGPSPDGTNGTGAQAYNAGPHTHLTPVINFQGDQDTTIIPGQSDQVIKQWIVTNNLAVPSSAIPAFTAPSTVTNVAAQGNNYGYELKEWKNNLGQVVLSRYLISGLGHAYTCSSGYPFTDTHGPCSTSIMYDFFQAHPMP